MGPPELAAAARPNATNISAGQVLFRVASCVDGLNKSSGDSCSRLISNVTKTASSFGGANFSNSSSHSGAPGSNADAAPTPNAVGGSRGIPAFVALFVWVCLLALVIFSLCRILCQCFGSNETSRTEYNEILGDYSPAGQATMVAVDAGAPVGCGKACAVGNASRRQFRDSRQRAARSAYGTDNPATQ
uniref:Uncharacterized protein TCIL3000_11_8790 n=1 Tax=Trypanosoma congolense (strain IL3000) TaxID=1068625 RepID=G0V1A2_TRYCI|nr:unnamed protein product [Trypanosoma congolense IL3000]